MNSPRILGLLFALVVRGLPPVPIPADNPPTEETIALGRRLYYDPVLSVDNTVACASCHDPKFGFADGKAVSDGVQGKKGTRNSPTVFNCAYFALQFWDGRRVSLEKQAEGHVQNPVEMAHTLKGVEDKLNADASYLSSSPGHSVPVPSNSRWWKKRSRRLNERWSAATRPLTDCGILRSPVPICTTYARRKFEDAERRYGLLYRRGQFEFAFG